MRLADLDAEIREEFKVWEFKEFTALIRVASAGEMGLGQFHSQQEDLGGKHSCSMYFCTQTTDGVITTWCSD